MQIDVFHRYGEPSHYAALSRYDVRYHVCDPIHAIGQFLKRKKSLRQIAEFVASALLSYFGTLRGEPRVRIYAFAPDSLYLSLWLLLWLRSGERYFHTSFSERVEDLSPLRKKVFELNLWLLARFMNGVACVNLVALETFGKRLPAFLVEHSLNTAEFARHPEYLAKGVYVGRMVAYKNVDVIASACADLDFEVDFVGKETPLSRSIADQYSTDAIRFLGFRDRSWIREKLGSYACLFLLSEAREPFGIVVLEAMAADCIPIVTRTAGTDTIFRDWTDYPFFVDPADPQTLKNAIRLLDDHALREATLDRLRTMIDRYDTASAADHWAVMFNSPTQIATAE